MPEAKMGCGRLFTAPRDNDAKLAARIFEQQLTGTGKTVSAPTADGTAFSKR